MRRGKAMINFINPMKIWENMIEISLNISICPKLLFMNCRKSWNLVCSSKTQSLEWQYVSEFSIALLPRELQPLLKTLKVKDSGKGSVTCGATAQCEPVHRTVCGLSSNAVRWWRCGTAACRDSKNCFTTTIAAQLNSHLPYPPHLPYILSVLSPYILLTQHPPLK